MFGFLIDLCMSYLWCWGSFFAPRLGWLGMVASLPSIVLPFRPTPSTSRVASCTVRWMVRSRWRRASARKPYALGLWRLGVFACPRFSLPSISPSCFRGTQHNNCVQTGSCSAALPSKSISKRVKDRHHGNWTRKPSWCIQVRCSSFRLAFGLAPLPTTHRPKGFRSP